MAKTGWEMVGTIGVDAGLCWVGDPCYVMHKEPGKGYPALGKDWRDFCATLDGPMPIVKSFDGLGVCVSSGYGDGAYPVYIKKNEDGRVVELKVVFDSSAVWRKEA